MLSLSRSLSVSMVIWFPLSNVRVCAHNASGHATGCQAVRTPYIYSDKHTSAREALQISPPTLQKQMGNSNPFFWVKILATQITHSLSWNDSGIVVVKIPSTFYG